MMMSSAYTKHESECIATLKWYNDSSLNNAIITMIERNHASILLDLCCGTGQLYPYIHTYYDRIQAVDLSPDMILRNKELNKDLADKITYLCCDTNDYLNHYPESIQSSTDVLFKNCMQFLDINPVIDVLKKQKYNACFVINTINCSPFNFFSQLHDFGLDFVSRTRNYLREADLDEYLGQIGFVKESQVISQDVGLLDWLKYHQCSKEQIDTLLGHISSLSEWELSQYGLVFEEGVYKMMRLEKLYCIIPYQ